MTKEGKAKRTELAALAGAAAAGAAAGAAVATVVSGAEFALVVLNIAARPPKRPPPDTRPKMELDGVPLLLLLADEEAPPLVLVTAPAHMAGYMSCTYWTSRCMID